MEKKSKILGGIIGLLLFIVLISGITYAWYVWTPDEDEYTEIATEVGTVKVSFDGGPNIIGKEIYPVSDMSLGIKKGITVSVDKKPVNGVTFNLYLDIKSLGDGLKEESFKYAIYRSNTLISSGNFSDDYLNNVEDPANPRLVNCSVNNTKHIVLLNTEMLNIDAYGENEKTYQLYIWIAGAEDNPDTMQNQNFEFTLHASGANAIDGEHASYPDITNIQEGSLAHNIVNLYNNSEKEAVVNDGVRYLLDREHLLVNDVDGNIRYYDKNPNNYIYFNCSDYSNQSSSTCDVWRIIGVFDDKVKIMKNSPIGSFSFDYNLNEGADEYNSSDWPDSSLNKLLNGAYYNSENTTYYNNSSTPTSVKFDTNNTGIKDTTRNLIADVNYSLGNIVSADTVQSAYKKERGPVTYKNDSYYSTMPISWYGKIALPYATDYGYAADLSLCHTDYHHNVPVMRLAWYCFISGCMNNNWMYQILTTDSWFLTPYGPFLNTYFDYTTSGYKGRVTSLSPTTPNLVYPALYLKPNLTVNANGDGSKSNPYQLVVNNESY